ncbi:MAG: carboxypeptidase-like regulatory domain-containing protein, partial [Bryobacteraceae bacterium]
MSRNPLRTLSLLALFCAGSFGADSAVLTVKVTDPSGAPAPGAQVELRAASGAAAGSAKTGSDGKAQFSALAAGQYTLRLTLSGFNPVERAVVVTEGEPLEIAITLALAPGKEEIEVTSKAGALANSDPNYRALRDAGTVETYAVNELKI